MATQFEHVFVMPVIVQNQKKKFPHDIGSNAAV
jgi:hypothetical protein